MSTTSLRIIQLVKSLSRGDQEFICVELSRHAANLKKPKGLRLQRKADGEYFNPDGIPNDDPVFNVLNEIERERHRTPGPPPPELD